MFTFSIPPCLEIGGIIYNPSPIVNLKQVWQVTAMHSIGAILEKIFQNSKWNSKQKQYSLWKYWDTVVGTKIAAQARPLRWSKHTLVVGVNDTCWLQELRFMEADIVTKIQGSCPDVKIDGIRWILNSAEKSG